MTRHEYLATKLAREEADGQPKTCWWPRHSRLLGDYLAAITGKDERALGEARKLLYKSGFDWETMVTRHERSGLMTEHVWLESELVESAIRRNVVEVTRLGEMLFENARKQAGRLLYYFPGLPEGRLKRLLEEHVSLFAESVRAKMEKRPKEQDFSEASRKANALALAEFAAEWF